MMGDFIGRHRELTLLKQLKRTERAKLAVLKGRRRIGKSRLLAEYGKSFSSVLVFSGLPPEEGVGALQQRKEFAQQLVRQTHTVVTELNDWSHLFWSLSEAISNTAVDGSTLVILDEITWMGMSDSTFLPKLKNAWDLYFSKHTSLIVALSGSLSAWIEDNILSSSAFLGRIDLKLTLEELPIYDCLKFWDCRRDVSTQEVFKVLSVTGGVPKYLEMVDPTQTAEKNIQQLCFSPSGFLYDEFENIFSDLFDKKHADYKNIVSCLVNGPAGRQQILKALGLPSGGKLSVLLNNLEKAGFIKKDMSWSIKNGTFGKICQYRLRDNYSRFYLKYILSNKTKIESAPDAQLDINNLVNWSSIAGLQFENLVLNNRDFILDQLYINPNDVVCANPYFQKKTARHAGCQIDYLIQTKFNVLFLCEIKFSKREIGSSVMREVEEKMSRLYKPKNFSVFPVLIHVNGVAESVEDDQFFTRIIDFSKVLT